jgi:cell division protein ZipA
MMSELRWALLILGVVFVLALALWERRRPRQASGALERGARRGSGGEPPPRLVREPPLTLPEVHVREHLTRPQLPVVEVTGSQPREEAAVPLSEPAAESAGEPPGIAAAAAVATAAAAPAPEDDMEVAADSPDAALPQEPLPHESLPHEPLPQVARAPEELPEPLPATALVVDWPAEHERRVLAVRLVAPQRERFAGRSLRQALAAEGFLLGQFEIFHKPDDERRAVLSAASLNRPGTFDMETMDSQHYGGLSLFAVLPGPKAPRQAFDELVFAARNLNERLHGVLQDEHGTPLTPARIAQLREQLRPGAPS